MKQVTQYITLQTSCILHHTYTLHVREEYSFLMGKDSILVQDAGLELSGENLARDLTGRGQLVSLGLKGCEQ